MSEIWGYKIRRTLRAFVQKGGFAASHPPKTNPPEHVPACEGGRGHKDRAN